MLQVTVALPSGRGEKFSLPQSSKVGDLRVLAQNFFSAWRLEASGCRS